MGCSLVNILVESGNFNEATILFSFVTTSLFMKCENGSHCPGVG